MTVYLGNAGKIILTRDSEDIINAGTMKLSISDTIYSNGSVVTDGKFGKLSSNGNIFEI